ncbi:MULTISPECIES: hypothetical protein [Rhodobacterales]|jgi:hypothetical protein|uniref:hypothetical protein n=1 Tax=Rhodobacterales TaxID=204455 RepID=UPI00237F360F|nr:hypothetical protein [Phaeobacter gallaeciensis]MDE4141778.1 hypothetical protein [Phaeobacter gallaeciensis]MDE4150274.1 hypothetical protein [Phaeobacter gallaeciensis]MDE4154449.1 hypothetical protein [Phaeobacter gallaeciensis]MDE4229891.1 hypothetical protein [Phaeobacter gallaeciensis]MDE4258915.1 hypothetical protein [Phaeobacter gallaeciensis]
MKITHFKSAAMKAAVVLVPSYLAAFLSDKMVWVVPTLAASSFFAATIGVKSEDAARNVEEDLESHTEHANQNHAEGMSVETGSN